MTVSVFTLLIVLLAEGGSTSWARNYPSMEACQTAELAAHDAAKTAIGVLDVGTLCVRSDFSPLVKPRA